MVIVDKVGSVRGEAGGEICIGDPGRDEVRLKRAGRGRPATERDVDDGRGETERARLDEGRRRGDGTRCWGRVDHRADGEVPVCSPTVRPLPTWSLLQPPSVLLRLGRNLWTPSGVGTVETESYEMSDIGLEPRRVAVGEPRGARPSETNSKPASGLSSSPAVANGLRNSAKSGEGGTGTDEMGAEDAKSNVKRPTPVGESND